MRFLEEKSDIGSFQLGVTKYQKRGDSIRCIWNLTSCWKSSLRLHPVWHIYFTVWVLNIFIFHTVSINICIYEMYFTFTCYIMLLRCNECMYECIEKTWFGEKLRNSKVFANKLDFDRYIYTFIYIIVVKGCFRTYKVMCSFKKLKQYLLKINKDYYFELYKMIL